MTPAARTSDAESAQYVYGVVRASARRRKAKSRGDGIAGKPLRVVAADGIAAITSELPDETLEAGREELLTHSRVLEDALKDGTVLPMQFGVVLSGDASVREDLLEAHRPELEEQLEAMENKVEMNVKGLYDEATLLREVIAENREVAELKEKTQAMPADAAYFERMRLGELVAEAVSAKREVDAEQALDKLVPLAVDTDIGDPIHEHMVVNASFLLDGERVQQFDEALEALAAEQHPRIGFKLTGPLPPHSFVELSMAG